MDMNGEPKRLKKSGGDYRNSTALVFSHFNFKNCGRVCRLIVFDIGIINNIFRSHNHNLRNNTGGYIEAKKLTRNENNFLF